MRKLGLKLYLSLIALGLLGAVLGVAQFGGVINPFVGTLIFIMLPFAGAMVGIAAKEREIYLKQQKD